MTLLFLFCPVDNFRVIIIVISSFCGFSSSSFSSLWFSTIAHDTPQQCKTTLSKAIAHTQANHRSLIEYAANHTGPQ